MSKGKPSPARVQLSKVSAHTCFPPRHSPHGLCFRQLQTSNSPSALLNSSMRKQPGDRSSSSISSGHLPRSLFSLCSHIIHRSVRTILQVIHDDWESIGPLKPTSPIPGFSRQNGSPIGPPSPSSQRAGDMEDREPVLTDAHRRLLMRLSPLESMEGNLANKLFPHPPDPKEMSVRGGTNWKSYLTRLAKEGNKKTSRPRSSQGSIPQEEGTHILVTFKEDIIALWNDPVVHRVLKRWGCNIRDMSGLYVSLLRFQIRNLMRIFTNPNRSFIISRH